MREWLRRRALEKDEQQELLAVELIRAAAAEIIDGEADHASLRVYVANQSWSKAEAKYRLSHLVLILDGYKDNMLRDSAIRVAQIVIDELTPRP
jgi:hypothetical protein